MGHFAMAEILLAESMIPDDLAEFFEPVPFGARSSVFNISTESYPGAHFATYPRKLVEPCVKAGSSQRGVCPECGAPWEREVEREGYNGIRAGSDVYTGQAYSHAQSAPRGPKRNFGEPRSSTIGWHPTCHHGHPPRPAIVFDPFAGSATTGVVANALGRDFIGVDLSRDYLVNQASRRLSRPHASPLRPEREEHHPLFDLASRTIAE